MSWTQYSEDMTVGPAAESMPDVPDVLLHLAKDLDTERRAILSLGGAYRAELMATGHRSPLVLASRARW